MTTTIRWAVNDREFQLDRTGAVTTLSIQGEPVFEGTHDELSQLIRYLQKVVHARPLNQGRRWSAEHDQALRAAHESGASPVELAKQFERTRGAIRARCVLLGLVEDEGDWRRFVQPRGEDSAS